ncbi:DUF481 domain-containing protein [Janthinobacterium agaricidamnosum]|uniref:Salt-induced outer membrane protein n=1 Tax=Janthinobacterium agaricidamnosum NBRC 102515 = DSM 9628 TaxID=1349767 RepID=W0V532_9BURK|nr:DUF481 domain-containing protein [Janthinobacterium agaricidamnosum]CDG82971.1 conserved hypothetical protein [Janthinobacterium agaricidamnosum NBRC 102515 = DSM 9628]
MKLFSLLALALAIAHGGAAAENTKDTQDSTGTPAAKVKKSRYLFDEVPIGTWATSAELGAITTSGNTEGTSVTGKIDARQELDDWSNQYIFSGYFKEDEIANDEGQRTRERSAERFSVSAKAAYKLLEDNAKLFVLASHVNDKFGAYTKYSTLAVGHSSRWYQTDDKSLDVELGPGYFNGIRESGESESGMTVRGAAAFKWKVSSSATFTQSLSVERGTSNMHSNAESALSAKINGTMQMKAAFVARNDSNVPEDKKNTDTQTSLTLVYSF